MKRIPVVSIDASEDTPPECPEGASVCSHLEELSSLRTEVHRLSALARTDELTGLFNFRHFGQALEVEMERTRRSGKPTSLLVIDLDNFKKVNDDHGHEFGNEVLRQVAALLICTIRRLDIACRYGGEEFTIILPDTPIKAAVSLAERLRALIAGIEFQTSEGRLLTTASFGVDVYADSREESWQQFLVRADRYLLQAKRSGKNRACHPDLIAPEGISAEERDALMASIQAGEF